MSQLYPVKCPGMIYKFNHETGKKEYTKCNALLFKLNEGGKCETICRRCKKTAPEGGFILSLLIHLIVVLLIIAGSDPLHPFGILQIPGNGLADAHLGLQFFQSLDQQFQLFFVGVAAQVQIVRHFGVPGQGVGMVVLGEGAHLYGDLRRVEAQDLLDHQRVGNAVGQVMEGTQFVGHGVADTQEGIDKAVCHLANGTELSEKFLCLMGMCQSNVQ